VLRSIDTSKRSSQESGGALRAQEPGEGRREHSPDSWLLDSDSCLLAKQALALLMPESVAELDLYVRTHFGITLPWRAACPDHDAPLTFLAEAFFFDFPEILARDGLRPVQKAIVMGSRKSGKTLTMAVLHMLNSTFKPGCSTAHVGPIQIQGQRCYQYFTGFLSRPAFAQTFKSSLISMTRLHNGSTVEILSGSVKSVSGPTPQKLSVDEFDQWDYDTFQTAIQMTVPSATAAAQTWLTSTRYNATGLLSQVLPLAAEQGYTVYRWCEWDTAQPYPHCPHTSEAEDSPFPRREGGQGVRCLLHTWHNPFTDQLEELCRQRLLRATGFRPISDILDKFTSSDPRTWAVQRNLANPAAGGMIFDTFADETHVRPAPTEAATWPATASVDWGYADPAIILVGRWSPSGDIHITYELYASRLSPDALASKAADIAEEHDVLIFHADPSEPGSIEHWRSRQLPIYAAKRRTILEGISAIRLRLRDASGSATLFIDPKCTNLIRALKAYRAVGAGPCACPGEQPAKHQDDHPVDALCYLLEAGPPPLFTGTTVALSIEDYRRASSTRS